MTDIHIKWGNLETIDSTQGESHVKVNAGIWVKHPQAKGHQ